MMALVGSRTALNGPPSKTLCALPAKLGQTIYTSLPKKSFLQVIVSNRGCIS